MKVQKLPFDPGDSGWARIIPADAGYPKLTGTQSTDVAVVGAGFAGLSAAKRLSELNPKARITVVEARSIAEGPAGRNSGFMIDVPHNLGSSNYLGTLDDDRQQISMNREAIEFADEVCNEFSMPSDVFGKPGKINAAATESGHRHNMSFARRLEQLGENYEMLDAGKMKEITGSDYYRSGIATPQTAVIQPAAYITGLARGLHSCGVEIFENTPIIDLARTGDGWRLKTPIASIDAQTVVLAVNGHVESFGYFNRRLVHIFLYASMTRRLTPDEIHLLGGEARWGLTPSDPFGSTVRRISGTSGDRIVIRNGISWAPGRTISEKRMNSVIRHHQSTFQARFPQIGDVTMEYQWGGLLCLSRNSVPAFGKLEENLYSACCQNGLGTTRGTLAGKLIAELICGVRSASLEYYLGQAQPKRMPPEPFASIGGNLSLRWGELKAGREK
ncbi:MAG: FAD-binding oxidoreductase [Acidiferrobacterales bacterium]|nr:FAD-binding oxidoreductase [Acidiferrobacterales bacterium]